MNEDNFYEALCEVFYEELLSDEEPFNKKGYRLEQLYEKAQDAEKKIIDDVLIVMCGWSYNTLLEKAKKKLEGAA